MYSRASWCYFLTVLFRTACKKWGANTLVLSQTALCRLLVLLRLLKAAFYSWTTCWKLFTWHYCPPQGKRVASCVEKLGACIYHYHQCFASFPWCALNILNSRMQPRQKRMHFSRASRAHHLDVSTFDCVLFLVSQLLTFTSLRIGRLSWMSLSGI